MPTPGLPSRKPLRLWPGVAAAVLLVVVGFVVPPLVPDGSMIGVFGMLVGALVILVWWLGFSRAAWFERLGAIAMIALAMIATRPLLHASVAGAGMGMLFYFLALPILCLALVAGAAAGRRLSAGRRSASVVVAMLLAAGLFTLLRTGGISAGSGGSDFHWRWTPTPEERLLAQQGGDKPRTRATISLEAPGHADWPGFRGPERDGIVRGVRIETDWTKSPPAEVWRQAVGPGWSSFAVDGDLLYTQEQRGEEESVSCYRLSSGEPVWRHSDAVRFWESNAGAGPRATPTLASGRVYTLGATGIVNALDAASGSVIWSRNAAADGDKKVPMWGFSGSPLVIDDLVVVAAAGWLAGYDVESGTPRWRGPTHGGGYSSPQRLTIDGVSQILLSHFEGVTSVAPADGTVLWEHAWEGGGIVQPALTADGDVLISAIAMSGGAGMRRLTVKQTSGGWTAEERWTSTGMKPYFNDLVVHEGHAYGFDNSIMSCIDVADGARKWKGGRYGNGQLFLLADQDVLLVLSEEGELALVSATPDQYKELARSPAIEGKTWNHPVLAGDILLVRNDEEMAAFRLALARR